MAFSFMLYKKLEGIPAFRQVLPLGLQHVVAMIVGCVTPAIIVSGAVSGGGMSQGDKVILIQVIKTGLCRYIRKNSFAVPGINGEGRFRF